LNVSLEIEWHPQAEETHRSQRKNAKRHAQER
jgi:hypothetical protein